MDEMIEKIYRRLLIAFVLALFVVAVAFVGTTLLRLREILHGGIPNPVMERYGILITLISIPMSLKCFQYLRNKIGTRPEESKPSFYARIYFLRLGILSLAVAFDAIGLYVTGSRNFFYMIFITLVTFLFCSPNKSEIVTLCERKDDVLS
ncbi:MAG: hypothetical protein BGN96_03295 [Bacteroidales bacterium 45-6]|nr:MAG: hypothetical protein BGN96_03295 [Bacteroidales bacterium 45-6]